MTVRSGNALATGSLRDCASCCYPGHRRRQKSVFLAAAGSGATDDSGAPAASASRLLGLSSANAPAALLTAPSPLKSCAPPERRT